MAAFPKPAMDDLHSATLNFLIHTLKAKQIEAARAGTLALRKTCWAELEHLRRRIALEFYYQTFHNGAGDAPR